MKIIELFIDPNFDEGGVDFISLVDRPAIEANFLTFTEEEVEDGTEPFYLGEVFCEDDQIEMARIINSLGEPVGTLEKEGYKIVGFKPVKSLKDELEKSRFDIISTPNNPSAEDTEQFRVRYKYQVAPGMGKPIIETSRTFCKDMLQYNRVFRIEDIIAMTEDCVNTDFGCYDILTFRGSYNCRHLWYKVLYRKQGAITGQIRPAQPPSSPSWAQPSTQVNNSRIDVKNEFGILSIIDDMPLFDNVDDALALAELIGCEGYHEYTVGDVTGYMACNEHIFESYDDYPKAARENACRARRYKEENPNIDCGTQVGWVRSSQLCNGEPVSEDTIARMSGFRRHQQNKNVPYEEGCGGIMWDAWGGDEGIDWAERKLEQIRKEKQSLEPYVEQVTTGVTVENVFNHSFSYDEEKMEITGAAMIPNKMIVRRNPITEELYYVFFTKDTIKALMERFMKNKYNDRANLEHTETMAKDTYVIESWIVNSPTADKSYSLGLEYPEGTWVVTMSVKNRTLWEDIKNGKYNGFSIEGFFNERMVFN